MSAPMFFGQSHRPSTKFPPSEVFARLKVDSLQCFAARSEPPASMGNLKPESVMQRMIPRNSWRQNVPFQTEAALRGGTVHLAAVYPGAELETGGHPAPHHHQRYALQRGRVFL